MVVVENEVLLVGQIAPLSSEELSRPDNQGQAKKDGRDLAPVSMALTS